MPDAILETRRVSLPETGDDLDKTPLRFTFNEPVDDLEALLVTVFNGAAPFYTPGVCRPLSGDASQYSVSALACPPLGTESYDYHYPTNRKLWADVTTAEFHLYVSELVPVSRAQHFCDRLTEEYGVTLQKNRDDVIPERRRRP